MATNFIQDGEVMDYIATTAVSSGDVVTINQRIGIALTDIAPGKTGALQVTGVFELPKDTTVSFSQGDLAYWDASAGNIDNTDTNLLAGYVVETAATADATVKVKINA